ncbi:MAG: D-2-hydroxyacid dehydrogenase [Eubacterium sp.]|nr:D-2-hydroxyacid dehydrogenase [Eubacterium sp.]
MKIAFLDYKSLGEDIDLSEFSGLGEVVKYNLLTAEEVGGKLDDADIVIVNKLEINEKTIGRAQKLKLVCVTATGTNNLDKEYLASRGIEWRNVAGYSTDCVAQHTFALLFYLLEKLNYYDNYVKSGQYIADKLFTHFGESFHELAGKTWGIIGMGEIGKRVAGIAEAFGCGVIYYSTSGKNNQQEYKRVEFHELLASSDIISVHAPLNSRTEKLINKEAFLKMKRSAIFINVGRGPIVVEEDLAWALETGEIAAAGLDVLVKEPMDSENPLLKVRDSRKLLITPHIAWAGAETRQRLMDIIERQIRGFISERG